MKLIFADKLKEEFIKRRDNFNRYGNEYESAKFETYDICADKIDEQKPVNAIIIPDTATNGDMIMTLFNVKIEFASDKFDIITVRYDGHCKTYDLDWWNAPFKKRE